MRLEDRIRHTLRAEAERFQPELATSPELAPLASRPRWLVIAGAAAGLAILIGVTALLTRPGPVEPSTHTLSPPTITTPEQATTAPEQATTIPHIPPQLAPFIPEPFVEDGVAFLVVTFIDGSTAELSWPEELDLMSGGVYPYGWAFIPDVAARDFFIRQGLVEDVVAQFGPVELLDGYPDGRGGTVGLWRPADAGGIDYLGFQFGEWAVLVYEYGPGSGSAPMGEEARAKWVRSFRGETTADGFLRLYGDEPLRIAIAGGYPSPMSMTFESQGGQVELVPEECQPGFVGDGIGSSEFVHWCDQGGLISVRIVGTAGFQQAVYDGLKIGAVHLGGVGGPDANGSSVSVRFHPEVSVRLHPEFAHPTRLRSGVRPDVVDGRSPHQISSLWPLTRTSLDFHFGSSCTLI